ncbi:hypothetical protein D3C75_1024290 [compost metagenome]
MIEVAVAAVESVTHELGGIFPGVDKDVPTFAHQLAKGVVGQLRFLGRRKNPGPDWLSRLGRCHRYLRDRHPVAFFVVRFGGQKRYRNHDAKADLQCIVHGLPSPPRPAK